MTSNRSSSSSSAARHAVAAALAALLGLAFGTLTSAQTTNLADQPIAAGANIPGNLALTLSVEFPTAISVANIGSYADTSTYLGYFDPLKCYTYNYNSTTPSSSYFQPAALATGTYRHTCSGQWSGNFMNWATMQTIDPFRWALSGGYRSVDTTTQTILEKAWGSAQGSAGSNFNYRGTSPASPNNLPSSLISSVTPFSAWSGFNSGIWGNGNAMVFSGSGTGYKTATTSSTVSDLTNDLSTANTSAGAAGPYRVYVRVDVCDATTSLGTGGLESNCVQYGSNYKPEGLMQQYANKVRFSAFSYLNGLGSTRQGGVLRKPMGFIGPTYPQPLSTSTVTNTRAEWDAGTGVMVTNPDTVSATLSGVSQSGVLNFLNKFGETSHNYMTYDNVSELYYAAVRYYENLGNVPEWTNSATSAELDGFPALPTWNDPISYWCQKNFILGIGDDHTWYDYNVGGATLLGRPGETCGRDVGYIQPGRFLDDEHGDARRHQPGDLSVAFRHGFHLLHRRPGLWRTRQRHPDRYDDAERADDHHFLDGRRGRRRTGEPEPVLPGHQVRRLYARNVDTRGTHQHPVQYEHRPHPDSVGHHRHQHHHERQSHAPAARQLFSGR